MTKELFIHVGAGKTGTTALQEFLRINRSKLQEKGLVLPDIGLVKTENAIGHHKLSGVGSHANPNVLSMWQAISKANEKKLLLTSETFHNRISQQDGVGFFTEIYNIFSGWEIRIIFYLRRQSQWQQSAYAQWVKGNMESLTIEEHTKRYKRNLADQVFCFSDVFGQQNIIVRPYEKQQFNGGNIFSDFFQIMGLSIDDSYDFPRRNPNPRLTVEALNFKRVVNSFCNDVSEARLCLNDLLSYSDHENAHSSTNIYHRHNLMSQKLQEKIEFENQGKYEIIAREFLGREDGNLFLDAPEFKSESRDKENREDECHRLYTYLFQQLYTKNQNLTRLNEELKLKLEKYTRAT